jgi:hypothetical protein
MAFNHPSALIEVQPDRHSGPENTRCDQKYCNLGLVLSRGSLIKQQEDAGAGSQGKQPQELPAEVGYGLMTIAYLLVFKFQHPAFGFRGAAGTWVLLMGHKNSVKPLIATAFYLRMSVLQQFSAVEMALLSLVSVDLAIHAILSVRRCRAAGIPGWDDVAHAGKQADAVLRVPGW